MNKSTPYGMIMDLPLEEFQEIEKCDSRRDEAIFKYVPTFRESLKKHMSNNGFTEYEFGNIDFFKSKMIVYVRLSKG